MKCIDFGHLPYRIHYAIAILGIGEKKSIDMQGEDNKKRGGRGKGAAANTWGDYDTGAKSQRGSNFGSGGKGEEWLYRYVVS